jgi:hypothetical protein
MDKKRIIPLVLIIVVLGVLPLISAQYYSSGNLAYNLRDGAERFIDGAITVGAPVFEIILGGYSGGIGNFSAGEIFFIRILLFLLLFLVIRFVLIKVKIFGEHKTGPVTLISIIVSIFAVRFMSANELILGILLPYGTMGTAIAIGLPFIIFFFFVHSISGASFMRRLLWIFYMICFIVLWLYNSSQMGEVMNTIYICILIAIILAMIFDSAIQGYFKIWEMSMFYKNANEKTIAALQHEYLQLIDVHTHEADNRRNYIRHQLQAMRANLP